MKIIKASSDRLVLQIQRHKVKFLDFSNNLDEIAVWLTLPIWLSVLWYQSESLAEFRNTVIIASIAIFVMIGGGITCIFLHQKDNFYEVDSYIFERKTNFLSAEYTSIWGSKQQQICSLSDVSRIYLEVFSETFPREPTFENPPTKLKTSYQVKLRLISEVEIKLEYNSISAFSNAEIQNSFRELITKTEDAIREVRNFLEKA